MEIKSRYRIPYHWLGTGAMLSELPMSNLTRKTYNNSPWRRMNAFMVATLVLICLFPGAPLFSQDLVAKAREEKKLVLYHSTGIDDTQQIIDRFRKRYPFLQVENHRLSSVKLIQRIITELRAGRDLADAYLISGLQTWLLKDMGHLAVYNSPERAKIRPALRDRQGYWTGVLWNLGVLGYNTNIVAPGAVPKTWQDLLQPRWQGQIGLEAEDVSWYVFVLHLMGQEKGRAFLQQLARQQPQLRSGHNLIAQLLTGGEFGLAPTARVHRVEEAKRQGAPVDWVAIEPLAPEPPVCISLPKNAARPNTGKLFIDFALSAEAQDIIYQQKRSPSRMDASQPIPRLAQIKLLEIEYDQEAKNYTRYAREYRDIFRLP
jgi:iron(III) transport system substrate-binding protein